MRSPTGFSLEDSGVPGTVAGLSDLVTWTLKGTNWSCAEVKQETLREACLTFCPQILQPGRWSQGQLEDKGVRSLGYMQE